MANCFICNIQMCVSQRSCTNLFGKNNVLKSGNKLHDVISEIVDIPLKVNAVHTNALCKRCYKMCTEFDDMNTSLKNMRSDLLKQFKTSLENQQLKYETYESDVISKQTAKTDSGTVKKLSKRVVLPASKLQPLPPDFLLKVDRFARIKPCNILKKTVPIMVSTVSTVVPISSAMSIQNKTVESTYYLSPLANKLDEHSFAKDSTDILKNFNLSGLTKELVSSDAPDDDEICDDHVRDVDDDEDNLKIDQDCTISVMPVTSASGDLVLEVQGIQPISKATNNTDMAEVKMEETGDANASNDIYSQNKIIFGKLQIINEDDDEGDDNERTIVIYDGNKISLVVPDDVSQQEEEHLDNGDSQDSNDVPQIELEVSGDEETANAIIAAAQEQGGAFIKVESGEMYHVQSIQSKIQEEIEEQQPLQMVSRDGDKYNCLLCENSIKNGNKLEQFAGDAESVMQHLKSEHDARLYICSICGILLRKRSDYTRHIRKEHSEHGGLAAAPVPGGGSGEVLRGGAGAAPGAGGRGRGRVHACGVCGRTYNSRTLLAEHANLHTGVRPHSCPRCKKSFASKYTLQAHLKTHSERPRPFKCSHCTKSFLTQQNLNQHEKTHSGVKDFVCSVCNKAFSTQHNLEVHGIVHSRARPHRCPHCPKGFARAAELRDHCRTHTGERPFACDMCSATFTQRSNLHSHRRATHFGEKPHHCTQCNKRFKRRRLLDYHIKSSHTGERPLECKVCSATFVYPEHYKKHIRIHSGVRPYKCEICGKSFTSRDNRNTHRFVHSDKKPYECLACGAGYMRKNLLYAHMKSSGHLAESIVVNQPRVVKNVNGPTLNVDNLETKSFDAIFPSDEQLEFDSNKLESEAATLNNVQSEETLLDGDEVAQMVTSDINGEMVRLIQIKLPNGNNGWMALND